jgi:phosphoribosyl-ATP pyrophosphohydrolase/phosphoribosyl-AMP cyclohydrolase
MKNEHMITEAPPEGGLDAVDLSVIRFDERGLVPCIVQEWNSGEVLMLAYMSEESLRKTLETGFTWFWSRSRSELWNKGATSGNLQRVRAMLYDCDGDTLLSLVEQAGPACHTGTHTCFDGRTLGSYPSSGPLFEGLEGLYRG